MERITIDLQLTDGKRDLVEANKKLFDGIEDSLLKRFGVYTVTTGAVRHKGSARMDAAGFMVVYSQDEEFAADLQWLTQAVKGWKAILDIPFVYITHCQVQDISC